MEDIKLETHGLKCDNPTCDWTDETIKIEDYENWLNKPCPKCGENVLTEEDYLNVQILLMAIEMVGNMTEEEQKEFANTVSAQNNGFDKLDGFEPDDYVNATFNTHKKITLEKVEKIDKK